MGPTLRGVGFRDEGLGRDGRLREALHDFLRWQGRGIGPAGALPFLHLRRAVAPVLLTHAPLVDVAVRVRTPLLQLQAPRTFLSLKMHTQLWHTEAHTARLVVSQPTRDMLQRYARCCMT